MKYFSTKKYLKTVGIFKNWVLLKAPFTELRNLERRQQIGYLLTLTMKTNDLENSWDFR